MITISLCMIVRNQEKPLSKCLSSVKDIADEIIIVDIGSQDNTKSAAAKYPAKIFDFIWNDNFSDARNFSFSKAAMDYILWLDADEIISEHDYHEFISLKNDMKENVDIVFMKYIKNSDKKNNITFPHYRERLLKRSNKYCWLYPINESIYIWGNIAYSDISIINYTL